MRRKVSKFVNTVMSSGKKSVAERIVYGALDIVAEKGNDDPVKIWDRALTNVQPRLEVKSRRVGGATELVLPRKDSMIKFMTEMILNNVVSSEEAQH